MFSIMELLPINSSFLIPNLPWLISHLKLKRCAAHDLVVGDIALVVRLAIQFD